MSNDINSQLYMLFDIAPAHIVTFLQWLAQSHNLPADLDFLDVGCGPGRLLQPCAALGWRVSGLEPDADYCAEAQRLAAQSGVMSVQHGGFSDIAAQHAYDLIAAVNNPFAYLVTTVAREDALARIYRALKPGSVLFLDMFHFLWILRHYRPPQDAVIQTSSGETIRRVTRHDIDWHASTFTHTDVFYRNGQYLSTQIHRMALMTVQEVLHLVAAAGFVRIQTYNNYAARQHQRITKDRIMVSAQKPFPTTLSVA